MKFPFFSMEGHHALVTGGAQGIGLEIVKFFVQFGARVTVWDFSDTAIVEAKKAISDSSGEVDWLRVDLRDSEQIRLASESLRPLNFLVNNAGITRDKTLAKMEWQDWNEVIQTNLTGVFLTTQFCLPKFKTDAVDKSIVNISSVVGIYGNFGQTNYAAAKAGVLGMTKTWAKELGRKGIRVNAIAPGFITTAMTGRMPSEVLDSMKSKVPLQRLGQPEDIAGGCLFLCSPWARYVNGTCLSVDGGLVI